MHWTVNLVKVQQRNRDGVKNNIKKFKVQRKPTK